MAFKKTSITHNQNRSVLSVSKDVKISSDTIIPDKGKKSLKTNVRRVVEDVTPLNNFISVFPFISLISLFGCIKSYLRSIGSKCRFNADLFILWLTVVGCGSIGVSSNKLCWMLYCDDSVTHYRRIMYRLDSLYKCGLITYRNVKGKRLYYISIDAENLIHKSVTKKQLREMHNYIKNSIK